MKFKTELPLSKQIPSGGTIWLLSFFAGLSVFSIAVLLQWLIYDDWLHDNGPLRLVGSALAFALTFVFAFRWQVAKRKQQLEVLRRVESIRWMNDRIRNSLQAIECVVYANNRHITDPVRDAVDAIENVLQEILNQTHSSSLNVSGLTDPGTAKPSV
jgi:hypothetical protein